MKLKHHADWSATNKKAIYIRITLSLLVVLTYVWTPSLFLRLLIIIYAIWQLFTLARHGFRCNICWGEMVKVIPLVMIAIGRFHFILHLLTIALIWHDTIIEIFKEKK